MRARFPAIAVAVTALLAGCEEEAPDVATQANAQSSEAVSPAARSRSASLDAATVEPPPIEEGTTPMAERVATIGLLNKRNNIAKDFEMRPGQIVREGPVIIRLEACERTAPYEFPEQTGAFVQLDVQPPRQEGYERVFSGWLFENSPSINVVEHPIYDVWVKDCAMSFPGEEE